MEFAIAVKAFIVKDDKLLVLKRQQNAPHKPGSWDIPGGRLEHGEDPFAGVKREAREETGLDVAVQNPLGIHSFTRDDGQRITMIIFLCSSPDDTVLLSEEHDAYEWAAMDRARSLVGDHFSPEIDAYTTFFQKHI